MSDPAHNGAGHETNGSGVSRNSGPVSRGLGWFSATRGDEPLELIRSNPLAYVLAAVIAHRANFRAGFNEHGLSPGEAFLGDYRSYGMSEQNYRTCKAILEKHGFATFRPTNKGTVAKLTDTRLFNPLRALTNGQTNGQPTDSQRTANGRVTTNKEVQEVKKYSLPPGEKPFPEPTWPTEAEWIAACKEIELPEWKARDEWLRQESASPRWKRMGNWRAHALRVKGWWMQDGSHMQPPTRATGRPQTGTRPKPDYSKGF
jgi:hypothetical protein